MTNSLDDRISVPPACRLNHTAWPHLSGLAEYKQLYQQSIREPDEFWGKVARELVSFEKNFHTTLYGSFERGDVSWFLGGHVNVSYNCVDRHAIATPDKPAIIYGADEPNEGRIITFRELLAQVSQLASCLLAQGVRKGDCVTIYLPMIPEAVIAMLACARIGAIHSIVFAGFSAESLRERIIDSESKLVITANESVRGGKIIQTGHVVNEAVKQSPSVQRVLILRRTPKPYDAWQDGRDLWWHEEIPKYPNYIDPEHMSSEDPLFLLYTSGSTGKPKGLVHTTAGYLVGAAATGKYVFDIHPQDRFFCGGDVGWITGHTYVVYSPLSLGCTTVVFEGTPVYPEPTRYWNIIRKHDVTHFYVAPTALRLLKKMEDITIPAMPTLRVLGSVGEPIAPEVWKWYFEVVGNSNAFLTDTYWQTETGSHLIAPLAGVTQMKPGSAGQAMFGIDAVIIDPVSAEIITEAGKEGVLAIRQPWPSMARTIWRAHQRYTETYLNVYKGFYFTGDGACRDEDGYFWIRGRVDDVVNVSGHRLSTAEIEAALQEDSLVAESAAVGVADELTGQSIHVFVGLKSHECPPDSGLASRLIKQVRRSIGPFAAPKKVHIVRDLPKTRSGKVMRRVLRKVLEGQEDSLGDISTLSDPTVVGEIIEIMRRSRV